MPIHKTAHTKPAAKSKTLCEPAVEGPAKLTMECFWVQQDWYRKIPGGIVLKRGKWDDPEVCAKAVRFLVDIVLAKDPREVTEADFYKNRLSGLFSGPFRNNVHLALAAGGYDVPPWELSKTSNAFFKERENRIAATRWLAGKVKKEPREIIGPDFHANGLKSLLTHHYNDSPYNALLDAGLVTKDDEAYMRSRQHGR